MMIKDLGYLSEDNLKLGDNDIIEDIKEKEGIILLF